MTRPASSQPGPRAEFDLAIVGAGIIGAWCARLASLAGVARILVIDRSLQATGATAKSAGLSLPYAVSPVRRRLTSISDAMYVDLLRDRPHLPVREYPIYFLTHADEWPALCERMVGPRLRRASENDLATLRAAVPGLSVSQSAVIGAGVFCQVSNTAGVTRAILHDAIAGGRVRLWEGRRVVDVEAQGGVRLLQCKDGHCVAALRVIWATGPWLDSPVAESAAVAKGVRVKRVVSLHIDAPVPSEACVVFSVIHDAFVQPMPLQNQWLLSFTRDVWDEAPDTLAQSLSAEDLRAGLELLSTFVPAWVPKCRSGRAFCDAYAPDWEPMVVPLSADPRVVFAGAGSGSGFRWAPAIARQAVQTAVLDRRQSWRAVGVGERPC